MQHKWKSDCGPPKPLENGVSTKNARWQTEPRQQPLSFRNHDSNSAISWKNSLKNLWKYMYKTENASSKHSTFRSRNMGFGMCKKNKLRTFKWLWNTSTLSFLDENSGGLSVFTINQQGKVATLLSDGLKLVQHFLSGDIQPPVLAASTAGIIPHLVPKQSTGIRDLYNVMSRVREHLETTPHDFLCDFCCVTPGRI